MRDRMALPTVLLALPLALLLCAWPSYAQAPGPPGPPDGVALLLYRLRLDSSTQYAAREFTIGAQDVRFTLHSGSVFQVLSGEGVTGLILLGRGEMQFAPGPQTEKGQLRIFGGSETLTTPFGAAF